ncbi:MAG: SDR family NAD(P)-dependent oxidoreductase, partial [Myxococcales bacterium]|nr:SDR family NAD(P)-dependent oxidoreductase [Myxococcales bacterium]
FREPLGVLVDSIEREANLSSLGRIIVRTRLVSALATRLRVEDLLRRHPEILEIELGPVLVIAGLQRTGTTLLHRLLAADPRTRAVLSWEALAPVPVPGETPGPHGWPAARVRRARRAQRALEYLSPEFFAIHPVEYDQPEEDVLLLDMSFMSQSPEATLWVPTYARWLETRDHTPAYAYLRRLMQLLSWQRPAQRWVLKSPHHMEHLDVVLRVFPGATVIQTHRDPSRTMPSFCSMVCHGAGIFSDTVDARALSEHWVRKVRRMVQRSLDVRATHGDSSFVDVLYEDLLADPIAQLRRIYQRAGLRFDDQAERAARELGRRQVRHRYGRHRYRLEDFGLSEDRIERELGAYRQRHGIPREPRDDAEPPAHDGRRDGHHGGGPGGVGHDGPVRALMTGVIDLLRRKDTLRPMGDHERLDGKTALVTGANSGLGRAVAIDLARRGAHVLMACRGGHPEAGQEVARASGSDRVEMLRVDLADLRSVDALGSTLRDRGRPLDIAIFNAGLMPARSRRSPQGFEVMFAVHFLSSFVLVRRMLADGILRPSTTSGERPRIVFVSSQTHRSAPPIDFDHFGAYTPYGLRGGLAAYGASKNHLTTYATELSRRLNPGPVVRVGVHALCPGPVATNIARSAPAWAAPALRGLMQRVFRSPEEAAKAVVLLAAGRAMEGRTGVYLHMLRETQASERARDPDQGRRLWAATEALLERCARAES